MGLLTSLTRTNPGGGQLPYISTLPTNLGLAGALTANVAHCYRFRVAASLTIATIKVVIGTASGNIDAGIYSSNGVTLTRLASSGSTAAAGSNAAQTLTLSAAVPLVPGTDYYLAFAADNATVTVGKSDGNYSFVGAFSNQAIQITSTFPLPSTIAIASTSGLSRVIELFAS